MMVFALNLLLAVGWILLTAEASAINAAFGFLLSHLVLRAAFRDDPYFRRFPRALGLLLFFLWELLKANLRVAADVLRPLSHLRPGIVALPVSLTSDVEKTLLANLITLTPGTLSLDFSEDGSTLYIHVLRIDTAEAVREEIARGFEHRIRELFS